MRRDIVAAFLIIGALLLAWEAWLKLCDEPVRCCPGPRAGWLGLCLTLLRPFSWFFRLGCGYDLRGQPTGPAGEMTCPECGRRIRNRREPITSPRRWRRANTGIACLALALVVRCAPAIHWRNWTRDLPTAVLVRGEPYMDAETSHIIRRELQERFDNGLIDDSDLDRMIALWVQDLRSDAQSRNADEAIERLQSLRGAASPAVAAALNSDDWQQSQLAALILRNDPTFEPTPDLLRVTVEGLRDDTIQFGTAGRYILNARGGMEYLISHADQASPYLARGMSGGDVQQRLLCATVAGAAGLGELVPQAFPILAEHLESNDIREDAMMAARGLAGFGPDIIPFLEPLTESPDRQQRELAHFIILRIGGDVDPQRLLREFPRAKVTAREFDATAMSLDELEFPR